MILTPQTKDAGRKERELVKLALKASAIREGVFPNPFYDNNLFKITEDDYQNLDIYKLEYRVGQYNSRGFYIGLRSKRGKDFIFIFTSNDEYTDEQIKLFDWAKEGNDEALKKAREILDEKIKKIVLEHEFPSRTWIVNFPETAEAKLMPIKSLINKEYLKASIKSKKEELKHNPSKVIQSSVAVVLSVLAVGAMHHSANLSVKKTEYNKDKVLVEENIEKINGIAKFTANAFTVTTQNGKYYFELFGTQIKESGETPVFSSLSYEIDKELYEKVHKYYDISYEYGKVGQIIGASNKVRDVHFVANTALKNRVEWDVMEELAEKITKEKAISINTFDQEQSEATASAETKIENQEIEGIVF